MAKNTMMGWSILALASVFLLVTTANAASPCEEAAAKVSPCKPFLANDDRKPSAACCTGLQSLEEKLKTKQDLRALCECLKKTAAQNAFKPDRARRLPQFCGASFPVDPAHDCTHLG